MAITTSPIAICRMGSPFASGTVVMIAVARSRSEMRWICLIFFLCLRVDSQVTQPWTQSIEALLASGDLPHARQQLADENAARGETPAGVFIGGENPFPEQRFHERPQLAPPAPTAAPAWPEV